MESVRDIRDVDRAYRPNTSKEAALLKVTNDILSALGDGSVSVLALLDLSSVVDTIDHEILIQRLKQVVIYLQMYMTRRPNSKVDRRM